MCPVWNDERLPYKYIALDFIQNQAQHYTVTLSKNVKIEIKSQIATLVYGERRIESPLSPDTNHFAILILKSPIKQMLQIQFLEIKDTAYLNSSPFFNVEMVDNAELDELTVDNHAAKPLVLFESIIAASHSSVRTQRNLENSKILCFLNPVIALYNYLIQGHCNQPQRFFNTLENYFATDEDKRSLFKVSGMAQIQIPPGTANISGVWSIIFCSLILRVMPCQDRISSEKESLFRP